MLKTQTIACVIIIPNDKKSHETEVAFWYFLIFINSAAPRL